MRVIKDIYRFLSPKFQNLFLDYKVELKPRKSWNEHNAHPELYQIINSGRRKYSELLQRVDKYKENIWTIKDSKAEKNPLRPTWNNGFLPGLDIIMIYTLIAENASKKYMEIGSGNSTKVAHMAIADMGLNTQIISVDPKPRAEIDDLADEIIRQPVETLDLNRFTELEENDILFVDNSHRILPNSDAMVFYLEILPRLKKGVIVHIHDIYLPYDYPQFMCDRFYSEQYGLAIYLLSNPTRFDIILPNYFVHKDEKLSKIVEPIWNKPNLKNVERHGGSFWLRVT